MVDYYRGDSVMIYQGRYTSYIAEFLEYCDDGRVAKVRVDLSPEPIKRTLRLLVENIGKFSEGDL